LRHLSVVFDDAEYGFTDVLQVALAFFQAQGAGLPSAPQCDQQQTKPTQDKWQPQLLTKRESIHLPSSKRFLFVR
jgi:hypothetical protein